jgi:3D (Asp-Asp-Asp) domain-containing protein
MKRSLIFLAITYAIVLAGGCLIGACLAPTKEVKVWMPRAYFYTQAAAPTKPAETYQDDGKEMLVSVAPAEYLGEFKLTAYCDCEICNGKWVGQPTASGTELTVGRTIAVDPDVIPLGSTVYINGLDYIAEDTGSAIKGKRIDVLFSTHEEALEFGVQYANVSIIRK